MKKNLKTSKGKCDFVVQFCIRKAIYHQSSVHVCWISPRTDRDSSWWRSLRILSTRYSSVMISPRPLSWSYIDNKILFVFFLIFTLCDSTCCWSGPSAPISIKNVRTPTNTEDTEDRIIHLWRWPLSTREERHWPSLAWHAVKIMKRCWPRRFWPRWFWLLAWSRERSPEGNILSWPRKCVPLYKNDVNIFIMFLSFIFFYRRWKMRSCHPLRTFSGGWRGSLDVANRMETSFSGSTHLSNGFGAAACEKFVGLGGLLRLPRGDLGVMFRDEVVPDLVLNLEQNTSCLTESCTSRSKHDRLCWWVREGRTPHI